MKTDGDRQTLVITGDSSGSSYGLTVGDQPIRLPAALFGALLTLVRARLSSDSGFVHVSPTHVCRIRKVLDRELGPGAGRRLIVDGGGGTYALTILREHIAAAPRFRTCPLSKLSLTRLRTAILAASTSAQRS